MKVQIRFLKNGKIKTMQKRYAEVFIKAKQAEYFEGEPKILEKVITPMPSARKKRGRKPGSNASGKRTYKRRDLKAEE